jgi:hypothetical protein
MSEPDYEGKNLFIIRNGKKVAKYEAGQGAVTSRSCRPHRAGWHQDRNAPLSRRHYPANVSARRRWLAVVGPDIGLAPCAGSTSTAALYVSDCLSSLKAINLQYRFMMTRPIAIALAATIDEELANAVRSN